MGLSLVFGCSDPAPVGDAGDGSGSSGGADSTGADTPGGSRQSDTLPGGTAEGGTTTDAVDGSSDGNADTSTTTTGEPPSGFEECFEDQFVNGIEFLPGYDDYDPVIGSHCVGTNHQDITGIERVVFLGDSVTVGSRPTAPAQSYRSVLAVALADEFNLVGADDFFWQSPNPLTGQSVNLHSGDFSSCAEWGARNDDLLVGTQIDDCFTEDDLNLRTLVVMTSGGNDLASLAQDAIDGVPYDELQATVDEFVQLKRDAIEWLADPARFPNGIFVVFANIYEFTDGTADVLACDGAGLGGFDMPVPNPDELTQLILGANEQYVSIAVDTQTDVHFMLETFCGHGFANEDPAAPCYRGPGTERWFDLTCIHPNPTGHGALADNFLSVILE